MNEDTIPKSFNFDDTPDIEVPVRYKSEDYILREPSEEAMEKFNSFRLAGAKMVDGKVTASVDRVSEAQSLLVSMCLYKNGKTIERAALRKWGSHKVRQMFECLKEIGKFDMPETVEGIDEAIKRLQERRKEIVEEKEEREAGNSPGA